jgi:hypothetical protein
MKHAERNFAFCSSVSNGSDGREDGPGQYQLDAIDWRWLSSMDFPPFPRRISILPPRSESVLISEQRNITRKPQAEGLEEGSRWFGASDTTGQQSPNAANPGGVAEMAVNARKRNKSWHPSGMRIFWLRDPVVR